ncbi:MAG: hypothetical protein ABIY37_17760 [Devosia sp.]
MSSAALLDAQSSAALLPAGVRREPRVQERQRPQSFHDAFDATSMFYDCFWHADAKRVLLVGPPPVNLVADYALATFSAFPSRAKLRQKGHTSLSVMITELLDVPEGSSAIGVTFGQETIELPIRANRSAQLEGARILFGMNKNNDLAWIREWASFHQRLHGTDTVILYDNGSTAYGADDAAETLRSIPGIARVGVPAWPQPFGRTDPAVRLNPYWAHFPQIASMSAVLRRYGARAGGILNADIDELVQAPGGRSIYDVASTLKHGLAVFRGRWIEAVPLSEPAADHRGYGLVQSDPIGARSRPNKWALDPRRPWVARLNVHPYWHWIAGRPMFSKVSPEGALYWHFRGINTNWKSDRTSQHPLPKALVPDTELAAAFAKAAS